ncbi:SDR family NAD(P)-dependent oxidoreductase [Candidatus Nitrotoga sp. M5]|uniref:SDR family NAD(P)-dependent oxidoreductase n=1 Tax=Candidatus Nitrotoga sp. M5 TaxID=2890409 RepID=UPI001EF59BE1|nr:SDR family oxidoreductase [Candidatus Nitrotoga sp. M5]CAH1387509.1 putative 3-oxoacyl-(acyl-carrier-protein) reductase FabG [Candidatus Nitrotoga sp. M5]
MNLGLHNYTALVTGSGQGIGQTIALRLAQERVKVAVNDINAERASETVAKINDAGGAAIEAVFDITDYRAVQQGLHKIESEYGGVDILVNNAAFLLGHHDFLETSPDDWDREIKVCFYGALNCCHVVAKGMVERKTGNIVSIASDAGRIGQAREVAYAASKSAVIGMTKSLAQELGRYNINVNAISPAGTDTPLRQSVEQKELERLGEEKYRERERKILRLYPLRRIGKPEDIANMVVFLASDAACNVTGQVISVNGGYAMPG